MRTLKFRAWVTDKLELFGREPGMFYSFEPDDAVCNGSGVLEGRGILMQFTGLLDKNGKEIYEGDLLRYEDEGNIMGSGVYTVQWDEEDAGWGLDGSATCAGQVMRLSEVIGNVHETPELEE